MKNWFPSSEWLAISLSFWKLMKSPERWVWIGCLTLPSLNRVAYLLSFGVSLKFIFAAAGGQVPETEIVWSCLTIASLFCLSGLIQWAGAWLDLKLRAVSTRIVRRMIAANLSNGVNLEKTEKLEALERFREIESGFVKKASRVLNDFIGMMASLLLIIVLMSLISAMIPMVGLFMLLVGVGAFIFFRLRVKTIPPSDKASSQAAKKELNQMARELVENEKKSKTLLNRYENNRFDRIRGRLVENQVKFNAKLALIIVVIGAMIMVLAFWFALQGRFDDVDPIYLVLFAFSLRFCIIQSRAALQKWGMLLRSRDVISVMRRMQRGDQDILGSGGLTLLSKSSLDVLDIDEEQEEAVL